MVGRPEARVRAPDGMQLTLFTPPDGGPWRPGPERGRDGQDHRARATALRRGYAAAMVDGPLDPPEPEPSLVLGVRPPARHVPPDAGSAARGRARRGSAMAMPSVTCSPARPSTTSRRCSRASCCSPAPASSRPRSFGRWCGGPGSSRRRGPGRPMRLAAEHEAAHDRPGLRTIDGRTMLAAGHARVVFSVIPQLPARGGGLADAPADLRGHPGAALGERAHAPRRGARARRVAGRRRRRAARRAAAPNTGVLRSRRPLSFRGFRAAC